MADQTPIFDDIIVRQEDTQSWFPPFISENSAPPQRKAITQYGVDNYRKAQDDMNEIKTTRPQDTPVSNRMSSLHTSISNFDRSLTQLLERLHGVLSPDHDHPTDPSKGNEDRPRVSPLSASLDNVIEKVREMTETVENVAERLEL